MPPLITFSDQLWLYNGPSWRHTSRQMHEVSVWLEQRHPLCSNPSHPGCSVSPSHHSHFIFLFLKLSLTASCHGTVTDLHCTSHGQGREDKIQPRLALASFPSHHRARKWVQTWMLVYHIDGEYEPCGLGEEISMRYLELIHIKYNPDVSLVCWANRGSEEFIKKKRNACCVWLAGSVMHAVKNYIASFQE